MILSLKALLLSGMFLVSDSALQENIHSNLSTQNSDLQKATKLLTQSSYVKVIENDSLQAIALQKEACDLGLGKACWYYAYSTENLKDFEHAQNILTKHCFINPSNVQSGESCTFLGIMLSQGRADVMQSERELYERGCELNDGWGCYRLARDFLAEENLLQAQNINNKALDILTQECSAGIAASCYYVGSLYEQPFIEDWVDATTRHTNMQYFFGKGCALGDGDSCMSKDLLD